MALDSSATLIDFIHPNVHGEIEPPAKPNSETAMILYIFSSKSLPSKIFN